MARPPTPLISPSRVIATALAIIDDEGVDALSIRSLGAKLGVNGSSLYHHFADKQAILDEVVTLILSELEPLFEEPMDVDEWIIAVCVHYRRALLDHPNAIQLVEGQFPAQYRETVEVTLFEHFEHLGIRRSYWYPIVEQIQAFNFGSAYFARAKKSSMGRSNALIDEAHFRNAVQALFRGLVDHYTNLTALDGAAQSPNESRKAVIAKRAAAD
jgi:TetR/AcrR family tetracycline transcriptional repressor